ncbi:PD-(D/E)XK nuclease family protein [Conexibacter sp. DBS9H8]|uniref:PD-(D/E)XK nuclease family protein n=1 Tax=Conexibacter sp. DBS9H8 TaxID=2937801 RepID=UPI00200D8C89|nr:PD-(D/E)XK nuclease family protein [Conexibacter sp. DBS9H8]
MSLRLVLGPANSAKAGELLGAYAAAARRDALLVVPTELDAVHYDRELAGEGVSFGATLTFAGLIDEIAARARCERPRLSGLARELLLGRVIAAAGLTHLASAAAGPGFRAGVGATIAGLRAQRVTPARLGAAVTAAGGDPPLRELAMLYRDYVDALTDAGAEDRPSHAWAALDALRARPDWWRGTPVFIYGFDDLTRTEQDALETLAGPVGAPVTVSVPFEPGRIAFAARAGLVAQLSERADRVQVLPALDTYYGAPALHHLERHLFEPDPPAGPPGGAVGLLEAGGAIAEAELVATEVAAALAEGVDPEEIVVVCRSLARSGALLEATLLRYGVPVTSAREVPLTHTALGRGVAAVLAGDARVYRRLTDDPATVDAWEAAARRAGVVGTAPLPDLDTAIAALMPSAALAPLTPAAELDVRAAALIGEVRAALEPVSPDELAALIPSLRLRPGTPGGVLLAEPLSIRARRFDRVLVTGLCDGEFPAADRPDPFIPEDRRRALAEAGGLVLDPPPDLLARERYLLYAILSRARERVSVSYRTCDEEGNEVAPSPFLESIRALFSELPVRRRGLADVVWTPAEAPTPRERALARAAATAPRRAPGEPELTRRLGPSARVRLRHRDRISAAAIERFHTCPVAWLIERQLAPEALEPDAEPLVRGTLLHDLLARQVAGEPDVLERVKVPGALAPGASAPVREAILAGIVAQARRFLAWADAHPAPGFTPSELEYDFRVDLGGGLVVSGRIDRIDTDRHGRAIVWDYKSGRDKPERSGRRWPEGAFQVALYMLAVARSLTLTPVAGIYQPLSGPDLRPRGIALADTGLALRDGDVTDPDALAALLAAVEARVRELAATLAAGELTPCPATCSPAGCAHPGICWAV